MRDTERPLAGGGTLGEYLTAQTLDIVTTYRALLHGSQNPLADDEAWDGCAAQAHSIIAECVRALTTGDAEEAGATDGTGPGRGRERPSAVRVAGIGALRARQGVHPVHSLRAGRILTGLVLGVLERAVEEQAADASRLVRCVAALEHAVWERIEAGAAGYDSHLLNEVRAVNSESRRALAREVHDRLGNHLGLAVRQVELCAALADEAPRGLREELSLVQNTLAETLDAVRHLATGLRQSDNSGSLENTIKAFVHAMEFEEPVVHVQVNGDEAWASPATLNELVLIVRECLRNTLAHAGARTLLVRADIAPHEIRGHVEDDGLGFDVREVLARGETNGLASMSERAKLLGGRLLVTSAPGRGTRVSFSLPNRSPSAGDRRKDVRVMLADDHTLLRSAVGKLLESEGGVTVVAETGSGRDLVELAERHHPDVLLLDVEMPDSHVHSTISDLRRRMPQLCVLVLSMHDDPRLIQELLNLGARGYLHKGVSNQALISAIHDVVAHPTQVTVAVPSQSLAPTPAPAPGSASGALSVREVEVLALVAAALTNRQIAHRLVITEGTVKRHLRNIFRKLGVTSRIEAVNRATATGLLSPPAQSPRRTGR
ncbi:response regulator [Streptomyces sp. NPDC050856]|uniref:response regulator n=1 Tax=Streptomyces sp. NPDC050856 TaxID=3154939 RepID=UPI0033D23161